MNNPNHPITRVLSKAPGIVLSIYAGIISFCTYSSMYAFRKPYGKALFEEAPEVFFLDYKIALVIFQVIGYMSSKFIGIKVISEMKGKRRYAFMLMLIGISWVALLLFGLVPAPYNVIFLLLNGLPLGMVWGIVFSYLEGRRFTEVMGLILCSSFMFASGFVKDIGGWLMVEMNVSEFWMPFVVGAIFALPLIISGYLLDKMPPPNEEDQQLRSKRVPMTGRDRGRLFKKFALGLTLLILVYVLVTAYRDFRDNFMSNIYADIKTTEYLEEHQVSSAELLSATQQDELQTIIDSVNFSKTEMPASLAVLAILMLTVVIRNNRRALLVNHIAIFLGVVMAGGATYAFHQGWLNVVPWLIMTGVGTYVAYIPYNTILYERFIATFKITANVGFLIYLADSFGYLGSVGVLIYKDVVLGFLDAEMSYVNFFIRGSYAMSVIGAVGLLISMIYFHRKKIPVLKDIQA